MLFDTHAHYDDDQFDGDRETLLASLPEQGVGLVVNPGCTVASSRTAVELARRFPHVYAAVGIHPENCGDFRPEDLDAIRALAREDKVVAIGEIGLDYYWPENPPRPLQQQVLRSQLALARELSLPVIIHDRDAHADTMGHRPGISRACGGCSTASPGPWKWPGSWWIWGGTCPSTGRPPSKTPGRPRRSSRPYPWTG